MIEKNNLIIGRAIFTLFVVVSLGIIVMQEKGQNLLLPRVDTKINSYLQDNYSNISTQLTKEKTTYKSNYFQSKIVSLKNKNLYFYIKYQKHNITDTYQTDYKEGKSLLTHIEKSLQKKIKQETNLDCIVHAINTLNNYSEKVQEQLIKEENLKELKFYYIETEVLVDTFDSNEITQKIIEILTRTQAKNITPKYYKIIVTDQNDITKSVEINNITTQFLDNENKIEIIQDIINNQSSKLLEENKIAYKYLN